MRDNFLAFLAPSPFAILFSVKTALGCVLALYCAHWFQLEQPQWALMTAFIVSQPYSGMVVQKGLARLLGTLVALFISLLLTAVAGQAPWLMMLLISTWFALCVTISTLLRSAWSYAFVLSGYSVAIMCLPTLTQPDLLFDQAVARCLEIMLGIVCSSLVSVLVLPQSVGDQLLKQVRVMWRSALTSLAREILQPDRKHSGLLGLLSQIVGVDTQREHAWFEGRQGWRRAQTVQAFSARLLTALRAGRAVGRQVQDLTPDDRARIEPWLQQVSDVLVQEQDNTRNWEDIRRKINEVADGAEHSVALDYAYSRLLLFLDRVIEAQQALNRVELDDLSPGQTVDLAVHRDLSVALAYGLRSFLNTLILTVLWFTTGWPSVAGAFILSSVVCGIFASRANAAQIGFGFLRGTLYAFPVAFICGQLLLSQLSGFPLLAAIMCVPLLIGAFGMLRPAIAGTATTFCTTFIVMSIQPDGYHYNIEFFLNDAFAMIIGVGIAVLVFKLVPLHNARWHGKRLARATWRDLAQLTRRRLSGADMWFSGRMADRLIQLAGFSASLPEAERQRWDDGVSGLDIGEELLHLRLCVAASKPDNEAIITATMQHIAGVLERGPSTDSLQALDQPLQQLAEQLQPLPRSKAKVLANAAILQLERSWKQWCVQRGEHDGVA